MFRKLKEFSKKYFWATLVLGLLIAMVLFYLIVEIILKFPFFNQFERADIATAVYLILSSACMLFFICYCFYKRQKIEEAARKLEQRGLSDYQEKYWYYVDLVYKISSREEYHSITLEEDWVKLFDIFLSKLTSLRRSQNYYFCDFDMAACLLNALYAKGSGEKFLEFLLDCICSLISEPRIYNIEFLLGGELILEERERYEKSSFGIPTPDLSKDTIVVLIETYLSMTPCRYSFSRLSDFLNILYVKSCRN